MTAKFEIVKKWERNGTQLEIVHCWLMDGMDYYNGYVTFPPAMIRHDEMMYFTWSDVHGGITYHHEFPDGSHKYGFDCMHSGDDTDPQTRDIDWLTGQCHLLMDDIMAVMEEI